MRLKSYLIDNTVSKYIEGAKSMSSRSMIRKKIIDYHHGNITFEDLRQYTQTKYLDGIKALDNCTYAKRIVDNKTVVEYKCPKLQYDISTTEQPFPKQLTTSIYFTDNCLHAKVISPITKDDEIYGYDIIHTFCRKIMQNINSKNENFKIIAPQNDLYNNFASSDYYADSVFIATDSIYYVSKSEFADEFYSFSKPQSLVFSELKSNRQRQYTIIILINLALFLATYVILKRNQLTFLKKSELLEKLVNEKTIHLNKAIGELKEANDKLQSREQELLENNQTKDKFFSLISHDLINPIGAIKMLIQHFLANYTNYDEEHKKRTITVINESLQNAQNLLKNLLTWSNLNRGRIDYSPAKHTLLTLINDVVKVLEPQIKNKHQKLIKKVPQEISIFADENMIKTILRNILSNANKYTPDGGLIEIGIVEDNFMPHDFTEIYIKDNGTGISKKTLKDLFIIDKTVSKNGTNNEKGTGLGLILAKEFIDKHGGTIRVESNEGEGSTFYFSLPKTEKIS